MNARFTFYCHTNKVNGKRYVGQTTDTMEERWKQHVWAAKQNIGARILGYSIRKYGPDAFDHEVLEVVVTTQKDADDIETRWIKEKQSQVPNGYNLSSGGGGSGRDHEITKRLKRESALSRREKISEQSKKAWARLTPEEKQARNERNAESLRLAWTKLTPDEREARARKLSESFSEESRRRIGEVSRARWATRREKYGKFSAKPLLTPEQRSEAARKMWANRREKYGESGFKRLLTPEQQREIKRKMWATRLKKYGKDGSSIPRSESVKKAWVSRRARYGPDGFKQAKPSSEQYGKAIRKGWANMTPEARAERVRKVQEGIRRAKEARLAARQPSIRFNLLAPRAA